MPSTRDCLRLILIVATFPIVASVWLMGMTISATGAENFLCLCCSGAICGHFYRHGAHVWLDRTVSALEALALLMICSLLGAISTYLIAASSHGFHDDWLGSVDHILWLSWPDYWGLATSNSFIITVLSYGYMSITIFPAFLVAILSFSAQQERVHRFILAFLISIVLTNIIFYFTPARSAAVHFLGITSNALPVPSVAHIQVIESLRSGKMTTIALNKIVGLVTFPSFHSTSAILFIWGSWKVRWFRAASLIVNLDMLAATPIIGGHYFVDVIGGAAVAACGIWASAKPRLLHRIIARAPISTFSMLKKSFAHTRMAYRT